MPIANLFEEVGAERVQQTTALPFYSKLTKDLVITHTIDPESEAGSAGSTFLKVQVLDTSNDPVATYPSGGDYGAGNSEIVIPSNYYKKGSNYRLKVYLKTTLDGFSQLKHFSILGQTLENKAGGNNEIVTLTPDVPHRTEYAEITFSISQLFPEGYDPVTELPYLSLLEIPDYTYTLKYNYPSYLDKNYYQSFTVSGVFNDEELGEVVEIKSDGTLGFKDNTIKDTFVNNHAPYEDNYQKKISVSSSTFNSQSKTKIVGDVTMNAVQQTLTVDFSMPYAEKGDGDNYSPKVEDDNKVYKTTFERTVRNTTIYGRNWFTLSTIYRTPNESYKDKADFVKAPLIIYSGDDHNTAEYFQYWKVETIAKFNASSREYTRCYDPQFNLAIFQDCKITPVYSAVSFAERNMPNPPTTWDMYNRYDPDATREYYKNEFNGVTISFIENSRNQYNDGGYGLKVNTDAKGDFVSFVDPAQAQNIVATRQGAADRVYSDFLLTFDNILGDGGKTILKDEYAAGNLMQAGLIIQGVADLESDGNGGYIVQDDTYYSDPSRVATYGGLTAAQVETYLTDGTLPEGTKIARSKFDVTALDNKNRIQYYFGLNVKESKSAQDLANKEAGTILQPGVDTSNKTRVFKAFSYIGTGTASAATLTDVKVSPTPVYFTIYNDASVQPGAQLPLGY